MGVTVFLDRDGVINRDSPDYIKNRNEFHFIPGSPEAVSRLSNAGAAVIVITNQSAVGRGMTTAEELDAIFDKMHQGIARAGGSLTDVFFCPHTPDAGCGCRKPAPGMIQAAMEKHGVDPMQSVMVGDSAKDIYCGRNAGCAVTVLVLTGNGRKALMELDAGGRRPDHVAEDLAAAADWILERFGN